MSDEKEQPPKPELNRRDFIKTTAAAAAAASTGIPAAATTQATTPAIAIPVLPQAIKTALATFKYSYVNQDLGRLRDAKNSFRALLDGEYRKEYEMNTGIKSEPANADEVVDNLKEDMEPFCARLRKKQNALKQLQGYDLTELNNFLKNPFLTKFYQNKDVLYDHLGIAWIRKYLSQPGKHPDAILLDIARLVQEAREIDQKDLLFTDEEVDESSQEPTQPVRSQNDSIKDKESVDQLKTMLGYGTNTPAATIINALPNRLHHAEQTMEEYHQCVHLRDLKRLNEIEEESRQTHSLINSILEGKYGFLGMSSTSSEQLDDIMGDEKDPKIIQAFKAYRSIIQQYEDIYDAFLKETGINYKEAEHIVDPEVYEERNSYSERHRDVMAINPESSLPIMFKDNISQPVEDIPKTVEQGLEYIVDTCRETLKKASIDPNNNQALITEVSERLPEFFAQQIPALMNQYFPEYWRNKQKKEQSHTEREESRRAEILWPGIDGPGNDYY